MRVLYFHISKTHLCTAAATTTTTITTITITTYWFCFLVFMAVVDQMMVVLDFCIEWWLISLRNVGHNHYTVQKPETIPSFEIIRTNKKHVTLIAVLFMTRMWLVSSSPVFSHFQQQHTEMLLLFQLRLLVQRNVHNFKF